jgi:hypothetical protein
MYITQKKTANKLIRKITLKKKTKKLNTGRSDFSLINFVAFSMKIQLILLFFGGKKIAKLFIK